jgi:hypothetical protein
MPSFHSPSSSLIETYAEVSQRSRLILIELRRLAALERESARAEDDLYIAIQDWILAANMVFDLTTRLGQMLHRLFYELGEPYDESRESSVIDSYRRIVEASGEALEDIASFAAKGRPIEGAETYRANIAHAREILEEASIREEARRMMPSLDRLDALAEAHIRSIAD